MAHPGPLSKSVRHGHSKNAEWTDVVAVAYEGPWPELPRLPGRRRWNELVLQWWEQVRAMPHCALWTPTDWLFCIETAFMKQQFWVDYADGKLQSTTATEIRRREDQMGTTAEARRKLRIRYVPAASDGDDLVGRDESDVVVLEQDEVGPGSATVTPLASRRARLTRSA